jgi:MFS family permease
MASEVITGVQVDGRATAPHAKLIFGIITMAAFLDVVDFSIVQVALPTIRQQLLVSFADSQWIIGAYGLTMAGFLMLSGRAGDFYGQKKLFVIGITVFSMASLTGGLAPSLLTLVVSRAVQGIGAAISTVTGFSIFVTLFPEGNERNKALGILVAVLSAGFAAGSIAGGVLTSLFGWRSVMFVNVPIGVVALVLSQKYLSPGNHWNLHCLPNSQSGSRDEVLARNQSAGNGITKEEAERNMIKEPKVHTVFLWDDDR